ncbi:FUN14 domain-containing protein 1 isoform X2 [Bicyclus anynana]|uniref:FUN14 domain-containing protein 1 isoform X2 n=1 Tax=Bicyclus anynana TaxID=110368 RepID=A0A6J1N3B9_BICAN|nr:FUN14 domain-containing protein 1 isoform X2 [Bicyclus anynana]
MAKPKKEESSDEAKKIVDDAKNFIEKAIADIGSTTATKQLILGTASGWITGFITMKIGKLAAVGIGGGVILLHIASQKGYIDINWDKINKRVDKITDKIEKEATGKSPDWFDKVISFAKDNSYYSAGFTGGFFFGIASS